MKHKTLIRNLLVVLSLSIAFILTSCACDHTWKDATCTTPKTCSDCNATEGEPLGHTWKDATCTTPKTCSECKATEGEPVDHTWQAATCTTPKTCSECKATEGEPVGHTWQAATCTTPKTCSECETIEGDVADHTYVDGACSMCGVADPAAQQAADANSAYINLLLAEGYCDLFSSMIYDAWYFAIYKADDYYSGAKAIPAFSGYTGIEKDVVEAGVNSYLSKLNYSISDTAQCAVLSTNSGALYVVDYALSNNDGFTNAKECINDGKALIKSLDANYASVNARSELTAYYSAVSSYFDFCYSPSGSFSQLSSALNSYRAACESSRTKCEFYFDN